MAETKIRIVWKIISILDEQPAISPHTKLFKVVQGGRIYKQFGIGLDYCYIPFLLSPQTQFFQKLYSLAKKELGITLDRTKPPFRIFIPRVSSEATFNISRIRLYLPNILAITLELSDLPSSMDTKDLVDIQYLHKLNPLNDIVKWTIGMAGSSDNQVATESPSFFARPAIRIDDICQPELLSEHIKININKYVGILIRNRDYEQMNTDIALEKWEESQHLTEKTIRKRIFINKQGLLYLTAEIPKGEAEESQPPDFVRTFDLYEIALFFDSFVDKYISLRLQNETFAEAILYKIKTWVEAPKVIFKSFSYCTVWEDLMDAFSLKSRIAYLVKEVNFERERQIQYEYRKAFVSKTPEADSLFASIREAIKRSSIQSSIKDIAIIDLEQAELSYKNGIFKACVIMLGSVLEAIMIGTLLRNDVLLKLQSDPSNCPKPIKKLGLASPDLPNKIANKLTFEDYKNAIHGLIPDIEKLKIEGIQSFRNAVHPWKSANEPNVYRTFELSRAMAHLSSLQILADRILQWIP